MITIHTRLTTSGNSKALRLPKVILKLSQLSDDVELEVRRGEIVIRDAKNPRPGWSEKIAQLLTQHGDPASDFADWEMAAGDGLDELAWDGPSYEDWLKRAKN